MSHSQFHSTKLFILRPLTHRDVNTPRGISAREVSPSPRLSSPRVSGRFLRSNSAFTEGLDYILSRPSAHYFCAQPTHQHLVCEQHPVLLWTSTTTGLAAD